jgi:hypothetical protein
VSWDVTRIKETRERIRWHLARRYPKKNDSLTTAPNEDDAARATKALTAVLPPIAVAVRRKTRLEEANMVKVWVVLVCFCDGSWWCVMKRSFVAAFSRWVIGFASRWVTLWANSAESVLRHDYLSEQLHWSKQLFSQI